ncbi:MAG: hypothetical protein E7157_04110 [Lactobacillales bacterium]|nr:hypothetical protein [Lactobacillales bacterium]
MYSLEKKIKRIDKIKSLEEKKIYILNLIKNFNNNKKIITIDYIYTTYQGKYNRLLQAKRFYSENNKEKKLFKLNKELEEVQEVCDMLSSIKNSISKEHKHSIKLLLSEKQIKDVDCAINHDTYSLIKKLNESDSSTMRLEILDELKEIYNASLKELRKQDKSRIYEKIKLIKILINFVNDSIRAEHKKVSKQKRENIKLDEEKETSTLSRRQMQIINDMKCGKELISYDIKDILAAYKEFITSFVNVYPKYVLMYARDITDRIVNDTINYDEVIILIGSIKDTIKNRLLQINKENEQERAILKEIRIVFDFICKNYSEDKTKTKHHYGYDVIYHFLQSEEGYPYLKKIAHHMPSLVNVRSNGEHILITILKEFIYNQKLMLKDKNSDYINPDYLKQVYILFSHSEYLKITKDEKIEIDHLINKYIDYLKSNIDKLDRHKEMKAEICALKTKNYFMNKSAKLKSINDGQLLWQANYIPHNRENALNRHDRIDISDEKPICFNDNTCYSVIENDNEKILKISVLDLACMIPNNATIDSQMYNDMIEHNDIHFQILRHLRFDYSKLNPTITYELSFDKINSTVKFRIYRSKTSVTKCDDKDLFYESNETLNKLSKLTHKLGLANNIPCDYMNIPTIEIIAKQLLNIQLIEYLDNNNIPFIYGGIEYINDYINNMNNLNTIFSRLDRDEFKEIYNLINSNVGEFGYSKEKFETDGIYELSLLNNVNYLMLFNQRLIIDLILKQEELKSKEEYQKEIDDLEHNLNLSIDHIRPNDMKFKNKRKRNKLKEYNFGY